MNHQQIDENNANAIALLFAAKPILVDVKPAIDAIPGMMRHTILTSGATMDCENYMGGESIITETAGLGGFAQAASFPLP
jgi:hypothetical protein